MKKTQRGLGKCDVQKCMNVSVYGKINTKVAFCHQALTILKTTKVLTIVLHAPTKQFTRKEKLYMYNVCV